jgi:general secretion pathway protein L
MSAAQAAVQASRGFLSWWGQELADLVPARLRRLGAGDGRRTIVAVEGERLVVHQDSGGRVTPRGELDAEAARSLAGATPTGIRLPQAACLIRRVELPASARADFDRILMLDLERATPFRRQDVYCDHLVEDGPAANGKLRVRQVVVKRAVLDGLIGRLTALGLRVDFADCWDDAGKRGLPIDLLRHHEEVARPRGNARLVPVLLLLTLALAGSAVAIGLNSYDSARRQLEAQTDAAKAKALAVRRALTRVESTLAEVAALRQLKSAKAPVVAIVDELSRLLPDGAWISALKLEGPTLDVTVVAPSTTELLNLFSGSALFTAADLAAPVVYDPAGKAERATIRLSVKPATPPGTSAAGGPTESRGPS